MNKWKLLEPFKLGTTTLRNRIVMPPMENHLNNADGSVSQKTIDFYAARAKGGVGAIIVQNTHVDDKYSISSQTDLGIHNDHMIAGLSDLAETIKANGAAALIQLGHGGPQCNPNVIEEFPGITGRRPIAPSVIPCKGTGGTLPREITITEIEGVEKAFAEAARRAKQAGFDGVEIHGAHGYLICSFLSPYTNTRTDKYGGSIENRALFAIEIIKRVREKVGTSFIVGYRISADEFVPKGLTIGEASKAAKMFEEAGVDYIHVSAGIYESGDHISPTLYMEKAHLIHLAADIKKVVRIPVITVASHDVETAEEALQKRKADLVALGRTLLADPDLPKKLAEGRTKDIKPCLRCYYCGGRFYTGQPIRCMVNPTCGRENEFRITPATVKKRVLVLGGGIAGMEAARLATLRGHDVTIVEKADNLGGHLIAASVPTFKHEVKKLLGWATNQVEKGHIKIRLNTEATTILIQKLKPEVLIIAVGSDYIIPLIPGRDKACAVTASEVLLGKKTVGNHVVVVGAGLIGCETALHVAETMGKKVTIVEMLNEPFAGMEVLLTTSLKERLDEADIEIYTGWHLEKILDKGVVCTDKNWQRHEMKADTVILATGLGAKKDLVEKFKSIAPEVYIIGDCVEDGRNICNAFEDAWRAALKI